MWPEHIGPTRSQSGSRNNVSPMHFRNSEVRNKYEGAMKPIHQGEEYEEFNA
jgi:hypothetical protein